MSRYPLSLQENRVLRYLVFFYLYVMQGIPAGFALSAINNYLVGQGVSPQSVGSFVAIVGLPWAVQFVWGPLIDRFQGSPMGRRRPWVLASQLLAFTASLGVLGVDDPPRQLSLLSAAFLVHSIFASIQDASVDALAISAIPPAERGRGNAVMRGGFLSGFSVGTAGLAWVLHAYGFRTAAGVQSLLLLAGMLFTFFVKEEPQNALLATQTAPGPLRIQPPWRDWQLGHLFRELYRGLASRPSAALFGSIALVYICQAVFNRSFTMHLIRELHWADEAVSVFSGTYGILATLLVTFIGGILSDKIGAGRLLLWVMVINSTFLLGFTLLAPYWSHPALATTGLVIASMLDPGTSVAAMPLLMLLCRKGVEGSQFTTYMALVNLCDIAGAYLTGQTLDWTTAPVLGFTAGVLLLLAALTSRFTFRKYPYLYVAATAKATSDPIGVNEESAA